MFAASFPDVSVRRGARYVDSGTVATAGGLSSGIDLALHAVDRFFGRKAALRTALDLEYQGTGWTDPDSNTAYLERPISTAEHPLCPVCEMEVLPTAPLRREHEGRTYLFCAEGCKTMFERMPEKFVFQ
ncbi:MAG: YHS domain-containing protein [Planctomycetes bacterium]|nr:YHS domain-containing protein [Planctomycetota bacterium]